MSGLRGKADHDGGRASKVQSLQPIVITLTATRPGSPIEPCATKLEHDPEKWTPVFRKDHAQIKEIERDDEESSRSSAKQLVLAPTAPKFTFVLFSRNGFVAAA